MILLAVDTSTPEGSAALLRDREILAEIGSSGHLNHSERLLPAVHLLLDSQGLGIGDVDAFAVAAGPGSFTGIRVGMSTVKSFAYALGKPMAAVSTLTALASKLRQPGVRLVCPILDAKKSQAYAALFEWKTGRLREILPQGSYRPDAFLSLCPAHRIIHFVGTGVAAFKEKIKSYLGDKARFSGRTPFIAHEVGLLGREKILAGEGPDTLGTAPLYLRGSQAEEGH